MRAYTAGGPNASASSNHTMVDVIASTTVRPRIYQFVIGNSATPADNGGMYYLARWTTSAGTAGSSPTPLAIDPADVAAIATAGITHSGEPTYASTQLAQIPLNQRATYTWNSYQPGYEFVNPATATTGIGLFLSSANTSIASNGQLWWFE